LGGRALPGSAAHLDSGHWWTAATSRSTDLRQAKESLRGLIFRIVLSPTAPDGKLSVHLEGALAALLRLGSGGKTQKGLSVKDQDFEYNEELLLVAGGRNQRCRTTLRCRV
tara:strand:+ start:102 stop:434 length:333 start_codon:yes stop_codon:yes gene_type:complete